MSSVWKMECECGAALNPYWIYCPWCGKSTETKRQRDLSEADEVIERRMRRGFLRGDGPSS